MGQGARETGEAQEMLPDLVPLPLGLSGEHHSSKLLGVLTLIHLHMFLLIQNVHLDLSDLEIQ